MFKLTQILDENSDGVITMDEYYFALETYNCRGELYTPNSDDNLSYQNKTMIKLFRLMDENQWNDDDLWKQIEDNKD